MDNSVTLLVASVSVSVSVSVPVFMASQKPINAQLSSTFNLLQFLFLFSFPFSSFIAFCDAHTRNTLPSSAIEDLSWRLISKSCLCSPLNIHIYVLTSG